MIYIERTITINKNTATIEEPIALYKGDRNVELQFIIKNSPLKYKSGLTATYGQLVIDRPEAEPIFSTCEKLSNGKVIFCITSEMIDELVELGDYSFQIRLYGGDGISRATLPVIDSGIVIKRPICDDVEELTAADKSFANFYPINLEEEDLEPFDEEGNYNKTDWNKGDLITAQKLDKIENAIDQTVTNLADTEEELRTLISTTDTETKALINSKDAAMKTYVDSQDQSLTNTINAKDAELRTYIGVKDAEVRSLIGAKDSAMKSYVDTQDAGLLGTINTKDAAMKEYVDSQNTAQTNAINNTINTKDSAMKTYVDTEVAKKADKVHTHEQYLTQHQDISHLATKAEIPTVPTNVSAFTNDAGYLTAHQSLEGLVSSNTITRIEVVSALPETEETGVLYIVIGE